MKKRISVTLSTDLLLQIDRLVGAPGSRSALVERVLKDHFQKMKAASIDQRDVEFINAYAEEFNAEMEDVLRFQADIFEDEVPRK
jgi:metal-responsive CopG/Arc/MetJ family transcriptional regulator